MIASAAFANESRCRVAGSALAFADGEAATRILAKEDDFVRAQSPFDRAARLKSDKPVDMQAYLRFLANSVRAWSTDERRDLDAAWCEIGRRIESKGWNITLPNPVVAIKSSGQEEGNTPYTRGDAIIFPESLVSAKQAGRALSHELFHIFSRTLGRSAPARQDALYSLIGYVRLDGEVAIPPDLRSRAITNPDSYAIHHAVKLRHGDASLLAVPFLFSSRTTYDVRRGGEFFDYLQFRLLPVRRVGKVWQVERDASDRPILIDPAQTNYADVVGRNIDENFQADEVLAGNFALALDGHPGRDAWLLDKLDAALKRR